MRKLRGTAGTPPAALAGAVTAAVAATALTGCGVDVGTHHEDRPYRAPAGITALRVSSGTGKVEIVAADVPAVTVRQRLQWTNNGNKPGPRQVVQNGTLSLSAKCARTAFGTSTCGISYRVQVPRATSVQVDSGDGAISVTGAGGTVRVTSDTGPITARDLRTASLHAESGDGAITIGGRAGTADVRSGTGPITANRLVTGRLTASTGDGSVRLALSSPPDTVRVTTGTGRVRLFLPGAQGYQVGLRSDTGAKRIDPAVHQDSRSTRRVTVTTGDGAITISPA